jgi:hypothetical protein
VAGPAATHSFWGVDSLVSEDAESIGSGVSILSKVSDDGLHARERFRPVLPPLNLCGEGRETDDVERRIQALRDALKAIDAELEQH